MHDGDLGAGGGLDPGERLAENTSNTIFLVEYVTKAVIARSAEVKKHIYVWKLWIN